MSLMGPASSPAPPAAGAVQERLQRRRVGRPPAHPIIILRITMITTMIMIMMIVTIMIMIMIMTTGRTALAARSARTERPEAGALATPIGRRPPRATVRPLRPRLPPLVVFARGRPPLRFRAPANAPPLEKPLKGSQRSFYKAFKRL